jgi:hypothetical protein
LPLGCKAFPYHFHHPLAMVVDPQFPHFHYHQLEFYSLP